MKMKYILIALFISLTQSCFSHSECYSDEYCYDYGCYTYNDYCYYDTDCGYN
jgi:hypothetical protein